jgi:hypothetical protein
MPGLTIRMNGWRLRNIIGAVLFQAARHCTVECESARQYRA